MSGVNRQWLLHRRPHGVTTRADFEYREIATPNQPLAIGELLLRNRYFLCAPTMRNWMEPPGNSLYPSIPLGRPIMAPVAGEVIASARDGVAPGDRVMTFTAWEDVSLVPAALAVTPIRAEFSYVEAMGPYGLNALTGYFGLLKVGLPRPGETLVVSGAAGSAGSAAAQIGKIKGCRVIGIAGGQEKCAWLRETCGLDAMIDYKSEATLERLSELCPNGIDVFFDNVGGDILQSAVENMAKFGRIVLCGQIASYNEDGPTPGPRNMMRLIYGSVRMQGFLAGDYAPEREAAIDELRGWVRAGRFAHREDVRTGFMQIPDTFAALFDGTNKGTLLAAIE
jgi:NADPH-dependent curcumin reductase CurA